MIFENRKKANVIKFQYKLLLPIYLIILVISFFIPLLPSYYFQISWTVLFVLVYYYLYSLHLNYIYFSDQGEKIIFRYITLNPLFENQESIEIPKTAFVKYELKKSFAGRRTDIIFFQNTPDGIAKYEPVSITSLTGEEVNRLLEVLGGYCKVRV